MSNNILSKSTPPFRPMQRILFIFPYNWLTSPRSVREVRLLESSGYETIIISTNLKYVVRSDMSVSSSPPFDVSSEGLGGYEIPFFVTSLISPRSSSVFKICFLIFYLISTIAYSMWLFSLTLLICAVKHVSLIHAHNTPDLTGLVASLIAKITGIPYVYEVHDLTPELYGETMNLPSNSIIFKLLKKIEYVTISNSSKNIFVSKTMQDHFESTYDLNPSKSVVVYSGWSKHFLDLFEYDNNELDKLLKETSLDNKFKILYLGSMEDGFRRGLDILIESMKHLVHDYKLTKIVLIFVGNGGGMKDELNHLAEDYQLDNYVSFQGMLPRHEAYKWLRVADVTVDPLRKAASTEIAVSNKLLEYMAAEKTIIASDLVGHREVLEDGYNGLLFNVDDPIDLANKINFLINNARNDDIRKLGCNARKDFCNKYSWENQQQKILDLYTEILQAGKR